MSEYPLALSEAELGRYRFMAEAAAGMERDLWAAAGITDGAVVADVGCGPGAVSVVLAGLVGESGRVVAVDRDPNAVEAARAAAVQAGATNISFDVGDADATGIAPGSVDVVMIRHVLAHNGPLEASIVAHAAGLVRPGGHVYLADIDMDGLRLRPPDPEIAELNALYNQWHAAQGNDLSVGLRLAELLATAGLVDIAHHGRVQIFALPVGLRPPSWAARETLVAAGSATADDLARWEAAFERIDKAEPRPTNFVPLFFASGRRSA